MDLLDVVLHYDCNLKCTYCTITDSMRARAGVDTQVIVGHIDEAALAGCTSLSLTGGEPTLRSDLLGLARYAAKRGMTDIKIQTNGLVFAEAANLDRALLSGVSRIGVSVHGYDGTDLTAYQKITQCGPSEAPLLLRAIDNLVAAEVALTVDLILMNSTRDELLNGLKALHRRGVKAFNIWLVSLTDQNRNNVDSLPKISDVLPVILSCMDYGREHGVVVNSLHVPRCLLSGYEEHVTHPGAGMDVCVVTPDSTFQLSRSRLAGGVKPERCLDCVFDSQCPGLRSDYVEQFGDGELVPVTDR